MKIVDMATLLCNPVDKTRRFEKAINLFGFQVAMLSPTEPSLERSARVVAAVKILEYLERDMGFRTDFCQRLENPIYRDVLEGMFNEGSGTRQLRSLWTSRELQTQIQLRVSEAKVVAKCVEFSLRFAQHPAGRHRQTGGITMAKHFVARTSAKTGSSKRTLNNRWHDYGATAVLLYLMLHEHKGFKPKNPSKKSFVERLLKQADDVGLAREFFTDYRNLKPILNGRGYLFAEVPSSIVIKDRPKITTNAFSPSEVKVIEQRREN